MKIRVVVQGALGRMGKEVVSALCQEPETEIVGATELAVTTDSLVLPGGSKSIPLSTDLNQILTETQPDVLVDFSTAAAAMSAARLATEKGVNLVIGATGFSPEDLDEIDRLVQASGVGAVVAPNFALGAVLMMHLAKMAAPYLDYAEIIELHHDKKADAPSGTSRLTAKEMAEARGKAFLQPPASNNEAESRGETTDGIAIHSVRLPGLMAHQEVIFGAAGQTLRIRHDQISREAFMPGIILAVKEVVKRKGLTRDLPALLDL
ncbi:MAG: 4-hydroxy-tetrahydrodipicolinate reductase [Dehalococcoidales bacterium]|nr:MAG: 4-hydroxy-tetrahydrodipicolinate reductase [Dehalococcoidales bacterium]